MPRVLLPSLLLLLAACGPRPDTATAESPPQVLLHGVQLQSFENDQLVLSGRAERLTYQRASGEVTATQAQVRMPARRQGQLVPAETPGGMEIRAPLMEGSLPARRMEASGGVEVRMANGLVARTPRATYDAAEQKARGQQGVAVRGPDYALNADSFELSFPEEKFTFEGSVKTVLGATE